MARLKAVIFGVRDVLAQQGTVDEKIFRQTGRLMRFLNQKGIKVVTVGNSKWTVTDDDGEKQPFHDAIAELWGVDIPAYIYGEDGFPAKQSTAALEHIREQNGWQANETLYVGNSVADMRSAVNGSTLFLNATWYGENTEYGFKLATPKEVARFIDVFCLREHWWFFSIEEEGLSVYSLAPFTTYTGEAEKHYSKNFISTVKKELGEEEDVQFWAKYLCTSLYFSGVYEDVSYITRYPGHRKGSFPPVLSESMSIFAKCFRGKYLSDLIIRHTQAMESKKNRDTVCFDTQLNTIHVNELPEKSPGKAFVKSPLNGKKTVLVLDDIITEGYSLEAARAYIEATGAKVICVSLLKTLNRDYHQIQPLDFEKRQYGPCNFEGVHHLKTFGYRRHIADRDAPTDLSNRLKQYMDWSWPV